MCGRFVQIDSTITRLQSILEFQLRVDTYSGQRQHHGSYNVAPGTAVTVIRAIDHGLGLAEMLWGIKPKWAKDSYRQLINARSETLLDKPTFRRLLNQKIIVPAQGFYEWKLNRRQESKPTKTPYYFHRTDEEPLLIAGLYETSVEASTGEITENFVILTTNANEMMAQYHDRMPVVLDYVQVPRWIHGETGNDQLDMINQPQRRNILTAHQVGARVNSARSDGPDLIENIQGGEQMDPPLFN